MGLRSWVDNKIKSIRPNRVIMAKKTKNCFMGLLGSHIGTEEAVDPVKNEKRSPDCQKHPEDHDEYIRFNKMGTFQTTKIITEALIFRNQ